MMKEEYIKYILLHYIYGTTFDAKFTKSWMTEDSFQEMIKSIPKGAFGYFGFNPEDRYIDLAHSLVEEISSSGAINKKGDDFLGVWRMIDQTAKDRAVREMQNALSVHDGIEALGIQSLKRAAIRIAKEDGFGEEPESFEDGGEAEEPIELTVDTGFFSNEANREKFATQAEISLADVEDSNLSNAEKAQARGYLQAAKALAETPDPPVDLIWTILNRANSIAGIASFFVALITLVAMAL